MDERPIIILGSGLWGCLLALHLHESHPEINFKLYGKSASLSGPQSWIFHESELTPSQNEWMNSLVSQKWPAHNVMFLKKSKRFQSPVHLLTIDKFHAEMVSKIAGSCLHLDEDMSMSRALKEGSFVIDARNLCHYKEGGAQKVVALELELEEGHGINLPVLMDATVSQMEGFHFFRYLPLTESKIIIENVRFQPTYHRPLYEMKNEIQMMVEQKGWKIKDVLRDEDFFLPLPFLDATFRQDGRVINLAGIQHDTTGSHLPDALNLISQMVNTSFRFGELRQVVQKFREQRRNVRKLFRRLNRLATDAKSSQDIHHLFQHIFTQQQESTLHRFYRGECTRFDWMKIMLGGFSLPRRNSRQEAPMIQRSVEKLDSGHALALNQSPNH